MNLWRIDKRVGCLGPEPEIGEQDTQVAKSLLLKILETQIGCVRAGFIPPYRGRLVDC